MENCCLVVGTKECSIKFIECIIRPDPVVRRNWSVLALELDVTSDRIAKLRQNIWLDKYTVDDVIPDILLVWVARFGSDAKLTKLIKVLEEKCESHSAGQLIRLAFNLPCKGAHKENICWDDLSPTYQRTIETKFAQKWPNIKLIGKSKWTRTVVGVNDCPVSKVAKLLNTSNASEIREKLSDIGRELGLSYENIKNIKFDVQVGKISSNDALHFILDHWAGNKGDEAFLDDLCDVLEFHGIKKCADYLRSQFNSLQTQQQVKHDASSQVDKFIIEKSKLKGKLLIDLMCGVKPRIFSNTLPEQLSYYIERNLLPRCFISKKIFETACPDVFVFEGIKASDLSVTAQNQETTSSSDELDSYSDSIMVRFIRLDQPSHLEQICERTTHPVHLIQFEQGRFKWIKSRGDIIVLQGLVEDTRNDYEINQNYILTDKTESAPICISDSPGMGKTALLGEIARRVDKLYENRYVIFLDFNKMIAEIQRLGIGNLQKSVEDAIINLVCQDDVEKTIFKALLPSSKIKIELMLDGLDELSSETYNLAFQSIKLIKESHKSIRLWTTTRPHLLEELEESLGVLGFNIKAFSEKDQVQFITRYWLRENLDVLRQDVNLFRLNQYAAKSILHVKNSLKRYENDVAGVPLQCLLVAEAFEQEAVSFAGMKDNLDQVPKLRITSMADLYGRLVSNKFQKYMIRYGTGNDAEFTALFSTHTILSLNLIFPHLTEKLDFCQSPVNLEIVLKTGIVEVSGKSIRFLHRTFAEYFVARFMAERLASVEEEWNQQLSNVLLNGVLECKKNVESLLIKEKMVNSYKFVNNVTTYFLNRIGTCIKQTIHNFEDGDRPRKIIFSCAHDSLSNLCGMLLKCLKRANVFADEELFLVSVKRSTLEFVRFAYKQVIGCQDNNKKVAFPLDIISLRVAVQRGHFGIFDFLFKSLGLQPILMDINGPLKTILHDCVINTRYSPDWTIEAKIEILTRLVATNNLLLEQKDEKNLTPILSSYVNIKLLLSLINLKANLFVADNENFTLIHMTNTQHRRLSTDEYDTLIDSIPVNWLKRLVNIKDKLKGETPLAKLLKLYDPHPKTLDKFWEAGADINAETNDGASVFAIAVSQRSKETLQKLIDLGATTSWTDKNGLTLLHMAAVTGNSDAIKLLITSHGIDSNIEAKNLSCSTPLDVLLHSNFTQLCGNRYIAGLTLYNLGGRLTKSKSYTSESIYNSMLEKGNVTSLRLLDHLQQKENNISTNPTKRTDESRSIIALASKDLSDDLPLLNDTRFQSLVQRFVVRSGDLVYKDKLGNTLLHIASLRSDEQALIELVENGADVNATNDMNQTPLHATCGPPSSPNAITFLFGDRDVCIRILPYLIGKGCDPFAFDDQNCTFLHSLLNVQFVQMSKEFPEPQKFPSLTPAQFHTLVVRLNKANLCSLFDVPGWIDGATPFQIAVKTILILDETLLLLHKSNVNFNACNYANLSVLAFAIEGGKDQTFLKKLIRYGAKYDHLLQDGNTLLHHSALCANLEATSLFLDMGISPNCRNENGQTPQHVVAPIISSAAIQVSKLLVERGGLFNIADNEGETPSSLIAAATAKITKNLAPSFDNCDTRLHKAASNIFEANELLYVVQALIEEKSIDVLAKDENMCTFLHCAIISREKMLTPNEFHSLSYCLIQNGYVSLLDTPGGTDGVTPLQKAIEYIEIEEETIALVQINGADLNALDYYGNCVLSYAISGKRTVGHLKALVKCGAKWCNSNGTKLIEFVVGNGTTAALEYFHTFSDVEQNVNSVRANTSVTNQLQRGLLHLASNRKDSQEGVKVIFYLIDNNADVFETNETGSTFLHTILTKTPNLSSQVFHNLVSGLLQRSLATLLLMPSGDGQLTPFRLAVKSLELNKETLGLFKSIGADFNEINSGGETLIASAIKANRSVNFVAQLIEFGADPTQLGSRGTSLLHLTAEYGSLETLCFLLNSKMIDVNLIDSVNSYKNMDLLQQVEIHDKNVFKAAAFALANMTKVINGKRSVLHAVADRESRISESIDMLIVLIRQGANPYVLDENNCTFLHRLLLHGSSVSPMDFHRIVEFLIENNHSWIINKAGWPLRSTPLQLAIKAFEIEKETLSLLYDNHANFNYSDQNGNSVLEYAMHGNRTEKVLLELIEFGANPNEIDGQGNTLLHIAAKTKNTEAIKCLIKNGLSVNSVNNDDCTPLVLSIQFGMSFDIVQLLIDNEADSNIREKSGKTALHFASLYENRSPNISRNFQNTVFSLASKVAEFTQSKPTMDAINLFRQTAPYPETPTDKQDYLKLCKMLIESGANVFLKDGDNCTFLHLLIRSCKVTPRQFHDFADYLISMGYASLFNVHSGKNMTTAFHNAVACLELNKKTLNLLLKHGVNINAFNKHNYTVLAAALNYNTDECISSLISAGADLNPPIANDGSSLLHVAAQFASFRFFKLILDHFVESGGNLNCITNCGASALIIATLARKNKTDSFQIITYLIENGANVLEEYKGFSFLQFFFFAFKSIPIPNLHDFIKTLVKKGFAAELAKEGGDERETTTPFHQAVKFNELEYKTLSLLKEENINFNLVNSKGDSLLMEAIRSKRSVDLLSHLVHFGANVNHRNNDNNTPLHIALIAQHLEAFVLLLNSGADINVVNNNNQVPIHFAFENEENIIEIIQSALENNADINLIELPLHKCAALKENAKAINLIKIFVDKGAFVFSKDLKDYTFLHLLASKTKEAALTPGQFHELASFLVMMGAGQIFSLPGGRVGATPILYMAENIDLEERTLALLDSIKFNFNYTDAQKQNILFYAVKGLRSKHFMSRLIKHGASWNFLANGNVNLLQFAAQHGNLMAVKFFLELNDINVNGQDENGNTPVHCAALQNETVDLFEKIKVLAEAGAKLNSCNVKGLTPLDILTDRKDVIFDLKTKLEVRIMLENWDTKLESIYQGKKQINCKNACNNLVKAKSQEDNEFEEINFSSIFCPGQPAYNARVAHLVQISAKTGVFHYSQANLYEFPPELVQARNLRSIDLSFNKITIIPQIISAFANLKHLNVNANKLEIIPDEIGQLENLQTLSLANNKIMSVPSAVTNLKNLRDINLSFNLISTFPIVLRNLNSLMVLDLSRNRITEVPDGVGEFRVVELILNKNNITIVSKDLAQCPNLRTLRMEENKLEIGGIPKEILTKSKISLLSLEGNLFDMKKLVELEGYEKYLDRYTSTKMKLG